MNSAGVPSHSFDLVWDYISQDEWVVENKPGSCSWQRGQFSSQRIHDGTRMIGWRNRFRAVCDSYGHIQYWGSEGKPATLLKMARMLNIVRERDRYKQLRNSI